MPYSDHQNIFPQTKSQVPEFCPGLGHPETPLQVDPDPFLDVCIYDTCSCESIGDCACFCDTIAAYAHVCAQHGKVVAWRTATLCRES